MERRVWDDYVTKMDVERLVKFSRDNIPAGRRSAGTYEKMEWYRL